MEKNCFSFYFLMLFVATCACAQAVSLEDENDITYLGADYMRQQLEKQKNSSDILVNEQYKNTLGLVRSLKKMDEHYVMMLQWLKHDQKNWLVYRDSRCRLNSYVYAYPENSKLFMANYNGCVSSENGRRLMFLKEIDFQINNSD